MDRTYASGAAGSAPAAPASPSIGYPTAGNPGTGTPATKPGPYWYHMIAEEIRKVITDAGLTPDHTNLGQLSAAIAARIAAVGGAYTAAGGIGINANRTIAANEINNWGQIQAAGTTTTLPALASTRVGASFTLSGGSYGGTLKGAGAEVIIGPTGNSANTYKIGPGEAVTVANNTIGWWVVAAGAAAADLQRQAYTAFSTAGAAPAYTLTPNPPLSALAANTRFRVLFHAAGTTGSNTLNVSGLGAVTLYQYDPTGAKTPAVIPAAGMLADVEYDGVFWILLNPLPPAGMAVSLVANGYQKLPGGLIIQWVQAAATANQTLNWPITFPNECLAALPGLVYATASNVWPLQVRSYSTSQVVTYSYNSAGGVVLGIGY